MTAHYKLQLHQLVIFVLLFLVSSALIAQAFSPASLSPAVGGSITTFLDKNISVEFSLKEDDPRFVESMQLTITTSSNDQTTNQVQVSLDRGQSWNTCKKAINNHWVCSFASGSGPLVREIASIQVVTN